MKQSKKNTLSALSGFPVKDDAMKGLSTGNRKGKPAERNQVILTPQSVVDVCNAVWPETGIVCDPCWTEGALTNPQIKRTEEDNGIDPEFAWPACTYVNAPYRDLKAWMLFGMRQGPEQIWLVPVRTHRKWWREWRETLTAYCELDPLAFHGFKQVFPAPLLLGYRGANNQAFLDAVYESDEISGGLFEK